MDEASGTTMVDSSGNANKGTLHNVMPGAVGVSGTAYTFGGATAKSYAEVPNAPSLNPSSANLHISFYLNTTSLPTSGDYDLMRKGAYPGAGVQDRAAAVGGDHVHLPGLVGQSQCHRGLGPKQRGLAPHRVHQDSLPGIAGDRRHGDGDQHRTVGSISNTYAVEIGAYPGSDWYKGKLDEVSIAIG
jgi:hypothetical protein